MIEKSNEVHQGIALISNYSYKSVPQVLAQQGLGKYCDPDFVAREMQEALDMTSEEMDIAAHQLLQQEHHLQYKTQPKPPPRLNRQDKL